MDWYAGNILSVTGEYFGVEKTIEKEFEVFKKSGTSSNYGAGAGGCAHVGPVSVASQENTPEGIAFSKSGMKMFIVGSEWKTDIEEYTLNGAYCIGSASFVDAFMISDVEQSPTDIVFSKSGTKMFMIGMNNDNVNEYTLTTAWDISSASFVDSFFVGGAAGERSPMGIAFSKSGEKMFIVGYYDDAVDEYTLTTAWDVSSASFVDTFSVKTENGVPEDIVFSKSGMKMFIVGSANANDYVYEYTLTAAWDVSSASFVDSFSVASQETTPTDIWFDSSGKTMFIIGHTGDDINVYKLTTAWDVSTASFVS
jgi:hypothetical protein